MSALICCLATSKPKHPLLLLTLLAKLLPNKFGLWLKFFKKLLSTHMHNWFIYYINAENILPTLRFSHKPALTTCDAITE